VTNGEGGLIMKNWILRKLFFSPLFKLQRKGYYQEAFNDGKLAQVYDDLHKEKKK
jgi:hypothetical protein